jgi:ethanolamine utilization protein EutN
MYLGRVIGNVVSTVKHSAFDNKKILLVKPLQPDGSVKKSTMVAVDTVGAGENDVVLVASEGRTAAEILAFDERMPLRSVIIAIVDDIDM